MMSLKLQQRAREGRPVRVALVGCGKFATMFAAQVRITQGIELVAVADLAPDRARRNLASAGWSEEAVAGLRISDDAAEVIRTDPLDVVVEATGDPVAGARHALLGIEHGRHMVMVNVEADVLCGPVLAARAASAGVVYSMAYGDQPALICELVDWARTTGFPVVAAGKGTKHELRYHQSTPDTVWSHYGITDEHARNSGMNPKMFNSFIDGTKSSIEMAAVANATGLAVPENGLLFPPCGAQDLHFVLRPESEGGCLAETGMVEVVSSVERDGRPVHGDLRWGVYVVIEAPTPYAARDLATYGMRLDPTGRFGSMYRPYHLIGLELGVSVAKAAIDGEATGCGREWRGDCVATAKRDLSAGEELDGEGGHRVHGTLVPATRSAAEGLLPIGLAHHTKLLRDVPRGGLLRLADVAIDETSEVWRLRSELRPTA